jgi:hypothetical protein
MQLLISKKQSNFATQRAGEDETVAGIAQSVQRLTTDRMIGVRWFNSRRGLGIFLFSTASSPALGPTQPPIQWVPEAPSPGVKRSWRKADHSTPSSAEVKNAWSYTSTRQYVLMAWCLVKNRAGLLKDNCIYTSRR